MLDLGRYLLGVAEVLLLAASSGLAGVALRRRFVPELHGSAAWLAAAIVALSLLILVAELLGSFGLFEALPYLVLVALVGIGSWLLCRSFPRSEGGRERTHGPPAGPPRTAATVTSAAKVTAAKVTAAT